MQSQDAALFALMRRAGFSCPSNRVLALVVLCVAFGGPSCFCGADAAAETATGARGTGGEKISVAVPYATNRLQEAHGSAPKVYGGDRGKPSFGRCETTFAPIPIINELVPRVPFYVPGETSRMRIEREADAEVFWQQLFAQVSPTSTESVVVFVHGYNNGFERNCRAAAGLQRTLEGKAIVLMFSWPSNGRPSDYMPDQADVEWSVPFLARVLQRLGERLGREKVQILAHSLGSRGVVFALERLSGDLGSGRVVGPLVLMAPDFDAQTFVEKLPRLSPLTGGITLYASSNDTPLKVSHQLHDSPRLGQAGEFLTVAEGMQTIDVSALGRYQVLGHEYFLFHPRVAEDLAVLLGEGRSASQRSGLRRLHSDGLVYWELLGDTQGGRDD